MDINLQYVLGHTCLCPRLYNEQNHQVNAITTTTEPVLSKLQLNLQFSFPFKIVPEVLLSLTCKFRHGQGRGGVLLSQYVAFVWYTIPYRWP